MAHGLGTWYANNYASSRVDGILTHWRLSPMLKFALSGAANDSGLMGEITTSPDRRKVREGNDMSAIEVVLRLCGAALAGYLLGSIPFGVLAGRLFGDRDPRSFGSGKTGATNVLRTLGPGPAAFVVAGDVLKGALAVLLARLVFFGGHSDPTIQATAEAVAGFCAIMGHNYSIFIGFKGGRGVLTGAGAMVVMAPFATLIGFFCALFPILITRYVSLGSILGAAGSIVAALILLVTHHDLLPHFVFILVGGVIIIVSHRDNIDRLLKGTERKLGQPAQPATG